MPRQTKIVITLFILFVLGVAVNSYIQSRRENNTDYNFVILAIRQNKTHTLTFQNRDSEIVLHNYRIHRSQDVKVGDLIRKKKYSKNLYVYRKDEVSGKFRKHLKVIPSGMFTFDWQEID